MPRFVIVAAGPAGRVGESPIRLGASNALCRREIRVGVVKLTLSPSIYSFQKILSAFEGVGRVDGARD
jgi:hypothetical protein